MPGMTYNLIWPVLLFEDISIHAKVCSHAYHVRDHSAL